MAKQQELQKKEQEIAEKISITLELEGGDAVGSALGVGVQERLSNS